MSTLYVDTITEKTSGNGVQIPGHVVQVASTATILAGSITSTTFVDLLSLSFTPKFSTSSLSVFVDWRIPMPTLLYSELIFISLFFF